MEFLLVWRCREKRNVGAARVKGNNCCWGEGGIPYVLYKKDDGTSMVRKWIKLNDLDNNKKKIQMSCEEENVRYSVCRRYYKLRVAKLLRNVPNTKIINFLNGAIFFDNLATKSCAKKGEIFARTARYCVLHFFFFFWYILDAGLYDHHRFLGPLLSAWFTMFGTRYTRGETFHDEGRGIT